MRSWLFLGWASLCVAGCVTVDPISVSQLPRKQDRRNRVYAESSNLILLAIPFGSDAADEARSELLRQCPQGRIEGVIAKGLHTMYFPFFAAAQGVSMQGYCVKGEGRTSSTKKG